MLVYFGKKDFKCEVCEKKFSLKCSFEKPYADS